MKVLRLTILTLLLAMASSALVNPVQAQPQRKLARDERRIERERKITERATATTRLEVGAGKHPNYNRLLKSTEYKLMYTEGLRYYGMKKKGKDYNTMANYRKAQSLLSKVVDSGALSGTPQEDSLSYYYGCAFYKSGSFDVSEVIFDNFRHGFPTSRFIEDAEYMYAMGFYFSSPGPEYDQTVTLRAMSAITEYEGRYPETAKKELCDQRMEELRRKLYAKSFENAKLYYTVGQYKAAVHALTNAIDEFPESPYREELMYMATRSAYLLAKNSVTSQMTDRYMSMMDSYYNLISEYPKTEHLGEVEKMRDEAREYITEHTKEEVEITATDDGN